MLQASFLTQSDKKLLILIYSAVHKKDFIDNERTSDTFKKMDVYYS